MVSCKLVLLCVIVFVVAAASALPQRHHAGRSRSAQVKQEEVGHNLYASALTQRQKDYG